MDIHENHVPLIRQDCLAGHFPDQSVCNLCGLLDKEGGKSFRLLLI